MPFAPATREKAKLKMAISGIEKSGKTYTAIKMMRALVGPQGRIAVIDTEHGSASKYVGEEEGFQFDAQEPTSFHPDILSKMIDEAVTDGYDGLIIDSLSHEWMGSGGCLETVDVVSKSGKTGGNSYFAWGEVTPAHNNFLAKIVRSPIHVIATMRMKTEYALETYSDQNGNKKNRPVKVGMGFVQRDGVGYEFDILMDMREGIGYIDHTSRCTAVQHLTVQHPGKELAETIKTWLEKGKEPALERLNEGGSLVTPATGAPQKEEKMARTPGAPKPATGEAPPRPSVPTVQQAQAAAAKAPTPAPKPSPSASAGGTAAGVRVAQDALASVTTSQAPPADDPNRKPAGMEGLKAVLAAGQAKGWDRPQMNDWILAQWPDLKGKDMLATFTVAQATVAKAHFDINTPPQLVPSA